MKVFVIMPFDPEFYLVYRNLIKLPLEGAGFTVSRADDPYADRTVHQNIYDEIVENLWDADYIIADLTNYKPNVIYELGIAHALNKRTIQISQNLDTRIPFDIKSQNVISYSVDNVDVNERETSRDVEITSDVSDNLLGVLRLAGQGRYIFSNIVDDYVHRSKRRIITVPSARS